MEKKREYKPLLFTTTVRNPARLKGFLNIFLGYDGDVLTDKLATSICSDLVKFGLYRPTKVSSLIKAKWNDEIMLNGKELEKIFKENPQDHKEAGFAKGWPSRFATQFDFAKELGFVFFQPGKKIQFSEVGRKLAEVIQIKISEDTYYIEEVHPELEQQAFLHALTKYQRRNPFVKVLNDNVPLVLLLQVIAKLNADPAFNGAGISRMELPLIIFWKDNDAEALYQRIKKLRKDYSYNPSSEVIYELCVDEIMKSDFKKFKLKSVVQEYPDEFIRKMRLTGLFSLRGAGRFLDINSKEKSTIDYILSNYSDYKLFTDERAYFDYMATTDQKLIKLSQPKPTKVSQNNADLEKWVKAFGWAKIESEFISLGNNGSSKDEILKFIPQPIRLEFLAALAVKAKYPEIVVKPNYICDDEGIPTCTAPGVGNKGDIECYDGNCGVLVEVTMLSGVAQTKAEVWPISRHLEEFGRPLEASKCYFIAPNIFKDSERQIKFIRSDENLDITAFSIVDFVKYVSSGKQPF